MTTASIDREWFPADEHRFDYGSDGAPGTQILFYRALEPGGYSRHLIGLQHLHGIMIEVVSRGPAA